MTKIHEKINIYVPKHVVERLRNDALMFEILKNDGRTVNMNRFLNLLIMGYYDSYAEECQNYRDKIVTELIHHEFREKEAHEIAERILKNIILPDVPSRKKSGREALPLKPTNASSDLIDHITQIDSMGDSLSGYICRLMMSYCEKPFSERERIIFKENYEKLKKACEKNSTISFSTIWNTKVHTVIPYSLEVGKEEMFNYLLCAETDLETGKQKAIVFRLNRISTLHYSNASNKITEEVKEHLDKMIEYGPQYMINDSEESCVRLTDSGRKNFSRIYFGRPQVDRVEIKDDGYYYYFKGSKDQLFIYFRRFGNDAEVISPESLRKRIAEFHMNAYENYK